ncbi:hypothetical protein [Sulfuricystis multivorans]|uniref:hypothetical protein n=1 Tax=Sulfuricystis multivorans TaxID=2211108 RepID=UPI000F84CB79|nr:hypothetical protein [Sulfuricystis multivorans]
MRLVLVFIALLMASFARAEVLTAFETPKGDVPAVSKESPVWIKCFECSTLKEKIIQKLKEAGYIVADRAGDAKTKVVIAVGVSVPDDGKAPRLYVDDVYGKGMGLIDPAIKGNEITGITSPFIGRGVAQIDAGSQYQGAKLTGSQTGGIVVAITEAFLTRFIHQKAADAVRTPGVVELSVRIDTDQVSKLGFGVIAAANTPETPDTLIDAALAKAIEGIVNGVPDVKPRKEQVKELTSAQ